MIQDLHSHTYYSFCGADTPEAVVEAAIRGGIDMIGITDHAHGVGEARLQHFRHPLQNAEWITSLRPGGILTTSA